VGTNTCRDRWDELNIFIIFWQFVVRHFRLRR
jgi:hypothetical protein